MRLLAETLVALAALAPPVSSQTWAVRFDGSVNGGVLDAAMRSDGRFAVLHHDGFDGRLSPVDVPPGTSAPSAMPVINSYPTAAGVDVVPLAVEPTSFVCLASEAGTSYCSPVTANSTGVPATIAARRSRGTPPTRSSRARRGPPAARST